MRVLLILLSTKRPNESIDAQTRDLCSAASEFNGRRAKRQVELLSLALGCLLVDNRIVFRVLARWLTALLREKINSSDRRSAHTKFQTLLYDSRRSYMPGRKIKHCNNKAVILTQPIHKLNCFYLRIFRDAVHCIKNVELFIDKPTKQVKIFIFLLMAATKVCFVFSSESEYI